jgi:hypothetical protein
MVEGVRCYEMLESVRELLSPYIDLVLSEEELTSVEDASGRL